MTMKSHNSIASPEQSDRDTTLTSQLTQRVSDSREAIAASVESNPGSAVLVALGAGFGLGVLIGASLAGSSRSNSSWWDADHAERYGRRMMDSFLQALPGSLRSQLRS